MLTFRRLLLLACFIMAIIASVKLDLAANASELWQESSPLSPLTSETNTVSPVSTPETAASVDTVPLPAQSAPENALTSPGEERDVVELQVPPQRDAAVVEPIRAQISLVLVGLVLVGLLGVVISIIVQARRT